MNLYGGVKYYCIYLWRFQVLRGLTIHTYDVSPSFEKPGFYKNIQKEQY